MSKLLKILLLLVIVVGGITGYFLWRAQPAEEPGAGQASLQSGEQGERGVRVEEKYGFTSETVSP